MAKLYTVKEAAEVWRVHPKSIYNWLANGRIKSIRVGSDHRIPQAQIEAGCPEKKTLRSPLAN